ncbi:MAG: hypothetical protein HKN23_11985 [Verrucomicrobiales bacterium]|nr:hypothetical protein [Verrucomicrobiales bacterium]
MTVRPVFSSICTHAMVAAMASLSVLGGSVGYSQERGILGKIFQKGGGKTLSPAGGGGGIQTGPVKETSEPETNAQSPTAYKAVPSNGRVPEMGRVVKPAKPNPALRDESASEKAFKPVTSSDLNLPAATRPPTKVTPRTSAQKSLASKAGLTHSDAYRTVGSNGKFKEPSRISAEPIQTRPPSTPALANTPAAPASASQDWTQQPGAQLPPMPKLFDPTANRSAPVLTETATPPSQFPPDSSASAANANDELSLPSTASRQPGGNPIVHTQTNPTAAKDEVRSILSETVPTPRSRSVSDSTPRLKRKFFFERKRRQ